MTKNLNDVLSRLSLGSPQAFDDLTVIPFEETGPNRSSSPLILLDQALSQGEARISEVSEAGVVSRIRVENLAKHPLLILDGEELVGAKQNRVVNLSILVAAKSTLDVPVSCVEAGRWAHRSRHFGTSGHMQFHSGRVRKAESVGTNMKFTGSRQSNQGQVWDDVDAVLDALQVPSPSRSMNDSYATLSGDLDVYANAFSLPGSSVGAVVLHNNRVLGLELLSDPTLFAAVWPKILKSYAVEAIVAKRGPTLARSNDSDPAFDLARVQTFMSAVANCSIDSHRAIGLGEDIRLSCEIVVGAALQFREEFVHLCAFSRI